MIDEMKNRNSVFNTIFNNMLNKHMYSHAYLFELHSEESYIYIHSFIKSLLCPKEKKYIETNECSDCSKCLEIDSENCLDFKVISDNNGVIRKDDILEIKRMFSTKSLNNKFRVYLIKNCDKMNDSASNALLKFLEEPNDNVIAILTTFNIKKVLPTIVSRCQILRINEEKTVKSNLLDNLYNNIDHNIMEKENFDDLVNASVNFIDFLNKNGNLTIVYLEELWGKYYLSKNSINNTFKLDNRLLLDIMIYFYFDVLKIKMGHVSNLYFFSNLDKLKEVSTYLGDDKIINILYVLFEAKENLNFNVNLNLFLDKLIIDVSEVLLG